MKFKFEKEFQEEVDCVEWDINKEYIAWLENKLEEERSQEPEVYHCFNCLKAKKFIGQEVLVCDGNNQKWEKRQLIDIEGNSPLPFRTSSRINSVYMKPLKKEKITPERAEKMLEDKEIGRAHV